MLMAYAWNYKSFARQISVEIQCIQGQGHWGNYNSCIRNEKTYFHLTEKSVQFSKIWSQSLILNHLGTDDDRLAAGSSFISIYTCSDTLIRASESCHIRAYRVVHGLGWPTGRVGSRFLVILACRVEKFCRLNFFNGARISYFYDTNSPPRYLIYFHACTRYLVEFWLLIFIHFWCCP
jgi:hypothetical protein